MSPFKTKKTICTAPPTAKDKDLLRAVSSANTEEDHTGVNCTIPIGFHGVCTSADKLQCLTQTETGIIPSEACGFR